MGTRVRRRWTALGALALLIGIAASLAAAAWAEYRREGPMVTWYPGVSSVTVTLRRDGFSWAVESAEDSATAAGYNVLDDRSRSFFSLSGNQWGTTVGRVWKERWTLGPPLPANPPGGRDPRRAIAREGLSLAIEDGAIPWPRGLARADTVTVWRPWNLVLNGFQRTRWPLAFAFAGAALMAWCIARSRRVHAPGHCRACGYSVEGFAVCPECGSSAL